MSLARVSELLTEFGLTEVYFGAEGVRVFTADDLLEAQTGYARLSDGADITGETEGDWKKEWVVFGEESATGDPFFANTSRDELPVYWAMHGMSRWEPGKVSPSLSRFLDSLRHLKSVSSQIVIQIEPDDTTMTDRKAIKALKAKLTELSGDCHFWNAFFERHIDWVEECAE